MLDGLTLADGPSTAFLAAAAFTAVAVAAVMAGISNRVKIAGLIALGISLRVFVATRDPLILQHWPLSDDSHYYFTIARNVALGHGLQHDSFNATTGFQPLYLLLITPFGLIDDPLRAINGILLLQTLIGAGCALLLYRLASLLGGPVVAMFALGIWATSWVFVTADLNGLETNTALLMLLATLVFYYQRFKAADSSPDARTHATLGILCGVSFLARVDLGLLIPVLGLDMLARHRAQLFTAAQLRKISGFAAGAILPMLPWLAYNVLAFGNILPSSGQAVRFLSLAYGFRHLVPPSSVAPEHFDIGHIPTEYYWLTIRRGAVELRALLEAAFPLWPAAAIVLGALALSFRHTIRKLQSVAFLLAFLTAVFFAYTCYIFGQWFFFRYLTPLTIGYLCILFVCLERIWKELPTNDRRVRLAVALLVPAILGKLLYPSLQYIEGALRENKPSAFYDAAVWFNANTPADATIGAFQSGIIGYFVERRFYGLDGKINVDSLHAMQSKTVDRYAQEKRIDYVTDWDWILDDLFARRSTDPGVLARAERVNNSPLIYRLRPP